MKLETKHQHRVQRRAYMAKRRDLCKERGICSRCGEKAMAKTSLCSTCREQYRLYQLAVHPYSVSIPLDLKESPRVWRELMELECLVTYYALGTMKRIKRRPNGYRPKRKLSLCFYPSTSRVSPPGEVKYRHSYRSKARK